MSLDHPIKITSSLSYTASWPCMHISTSRKESKHRWNPSSHTNARSIDFASRCETGCYGHKARPTRTLHTHIHTLEWGSLSAARARVKVRTRGYTYDEKSEERERREASSWCSGVGEEERFFRRWRQREISHMRLILAYIGVYVRAMRCIKRLCVYHSTCGLSIFRARRKREAMRWARAWDSSVCVRDYFLEIVCVSDFMIDLYLDC